MSDDATPQPAAPPEVTRDEVIETLRALNRSAQELGPGGWPSNHPRITDNAERFQSQVAEALLAAESEPPQYYLASALSGSCRLCHGQE